MRNCCARWSRALGADGGAVLAVLWAGQRREQRAGDCQVLRIRIGNEHPDR